MFEKYQADHPSQSVPMTRQWVGAHPLHFIASGGGLGRMGKGAGTFGTLLGAVLYIVLEPSLGPALLGALFAALFVLGAFAAEEANSSLGVHDHGGVVIDEIAAIGLLYAFLPAGSLSWVLGFVAFRLFDIFKPYPIQIVDQKFNNGWGVMLDDLVAALYSWLVVYFILWCVS